MKRKQLVIALTSALALLLIMASSAMAAPRATPQPGDINAHDFVRRVTNPFFPLRPGTTFYYEGSEEGTPTSTVVTVTSDTKKILGVTTTVVHDQGFSDGVLSEDTFDWYAQDEDGNVWYFGEDTKELDESGNVISTEGSWQAGVDGARAGIVMEAHPKVGDRYYQEFLRGQAEDQAQVLEERPVVSTETVPKERILLFARLPWREEFR